MIKFKTLVSLLVTCTCISCIIVHLLVPFYFFFNVFCFNFILTSESWFLGVVAEGCVIVVWLGLHFLEVLITQHFDELNFIPHVQYYRIHTMFRLTDWLLLVGQTQHVEQKCLAFTRRLHHYVGQPQEPEHSSRSSGHSISYNLRLKIEGGLCIALPGVPKKAECSIFVTLLLKNIAYILISSDKALSSEKNDANIIEIGWVVLILWSFLKT